MLVQTMRLYKALGGVPTTITKPHHMCGHAPVVTTLEACLPEAFPVVQVPLA